MTGLNASEQSDARIPESEKKAQAIIDHAYEAFIGIDVNGAVTDWSPQAERIFGWLREEVIGQQLSNIIIPTQYRDDHKKGLSHFQETGEAPLLNKKIEIPALHRTGFEFPIELAVFVVPSQNGISFGAFIRDITERKQLEEKLQREFKEQSRLGSLSAAVGSALVRAATMRELLQGCAEAIVQHLNATLARIWTVDETGEFIILQASAGLYTHIDGAHSRITIGEHKLGLITSNKKAHLTNDLQNDLQVSDTEWAIQEGLVSFAGYPLLVNENLVGVMAMFARHELTEQTLKGLGSLADHVALGIERKNTEQAHAELANIVQSSDDAIIAKSLDGTILHWNQAAEKLFGYAAKEIIGKSISMLLPVDRTHELDGIMERLRRGEHIVPYETSRQRKDGSLVDISLTLSPIRDSAGNIVGASAIARNISDQKHRESNLARQHAATETKTQQLQAVMDAMTIFVQGGDWRETTSSLLNSALKQTDSQYGFVGAVIPDGVLRTLAHKGLAWHPDTSHEVYDLAVNNYDELGYMEFSNFDNLFGAVITAGQPIISNQIVAQPRSSTTSNEQVVLKNFLGVPIRQNADVVGMIGLANRSDGFTDMERKKVEILAHMASVLFDGYRRQAIEEELRHQIWESSEKLQTMIASSYDAFIAFDQFGRITDWNPQAEKTFGWTTAEAVGLNLATVIKDVGLLTFLGTAEGHNLNKQIELTALHRDGFEFPIEVAVFPVTVSGAQLFCTFVHDITERRLVQETERRLSVMEEREDFMFTLTHDLKNPLIGANRILEQLVNGEFGNVPDEPAEILSKLKDSNQGLIGLIQNLIHMYRYEKNALKLSFVEINLCQLVTACIAEFEYVAQVQSKTIKADLPSIEAKIMADANSIRRVLQNLIDNALKFGSEGEPIEISLRVNGDTVELNVLNTGVAIPLKDRDAASSNASGRAAVAKGMLQAADLAYISATKLLLLIMEKSPVPATN